jgi:hypothetical protein
MVQKGKFAACAFALERQLKRVDLPTLGKPTMPHCKAIVDLIYFSSTKVRKLSGSSLRFCGTSFQRKMPFLIHDTFSCIENSAFLYITILSYINFIPDIVTMYI